MRTLVPQWIAFNARLIERMDLLGDCGNFCEQASLSLAVAATRTRFTLLADALNFPAHLQEQPIGSVFGQTDPVLIHYHWLTGARRATVAKPVSQRESAHRKLQPARDRRSAALTAHRACRPTP